MPYTNEEGGLLNNFAREPKVYEAEPPTNEQKRTYIFLGVAGAALVAGLIVVAFFVSHVS
ncbi:MAG: ssl1498 family light-harvesting-like protein [Nodularia sp. (in: Bacteria)]|nr:MAG: ssl1498 family light-harvesting-like protein [Nodularia sp. (in: cyanobacteria)]